MTILSPFIVPDPGNSQNIYNLRGTLTLTELNFGPRYIFVSPDRTKFYGLNSSNDTIYQYNMSVAGEVDSATYSSLSFSVNAQTADPSAIFIRADGIKMYVVGQDNDTVFQYTLSTAWNISTASYDTVSFSVTTQSTSPRSITFKPDGTIMYVSDSGSGIIYQYTLSTPWSLATASYASLSISPSQTNIILNEAFSGIYFNSTGNTLYTGNQSRVHIYNLTTPWDISTTAKSRRYIYTIPYWATSGLNHVFVDVANSQVYGLSGNPFACALQFNY